MPKSEASSTRWRGFVHNSIQVILTIVATTVVCFTVFFHSGRLVPDHVNTTLSLERVNKTILSALNIAVDELKEEMSKLASANMSTGLINEEQSATPVLPPAEAALHEKKLAINYAQIWMSPMEVNLVLRYLAQRETYLEWGSGGSTQNFARFAKKRAVSIEHDLAWCQDMRKNLQADDALSHVEYRCVPVKRGTLGWGKTHGFEEGTYTQFRSYVDEIDKVGEKNFDIVLVDGRARVPCAVKALSYLKADSVLVVHDGSRFFNPGSKASDYRAIWSYYDTIDSIGGDGRQGLLILKRKASLHHLEGDHKEVQNILNNKFLTAAAL